MASISSPPLSTEPIHRAMRSVDPSVPTWRPNRTYRLKIEGRDQDILPRLLSWGPVCRSNERLDQHLRRLGFGSIIARLFSFLSSLKRVCKALCKKMKAR